MMFLVKYVMYIGMYKIILLIVKGFNINIFFIDRLLYDYEYEVV